jgi:hypothetical protein
MDPGLLQISVLFSGSSVTLLTLEYKRGIPAPLSRASAFGTLQQGRLSRLSTQRFQYGTSHEAAVIPLCSDPRTCLEPMSLRLSPTPRNWAAMTFTSAYPTVPHLLVPRTYWALRPGI